MQIKLKIKNVFSLIKAGKQCNKTGHHKEALFVLNVASELLLRCSFKAVGSIDKTVSNLNNNMDMCIVLYEKGRAYFQLGKYGAARIAYSDAIKTTPTTANYTKPEIGLRKVNVLVEKEYGLKPPRKFIV